jgi:hypothetical protein
MNEAIMNPGPLEESAKDISGQIPASGGQMSDFASDPPPPRWLFVLLALVGLAVAGAILLAAL